MIHLSHPTGNANVRAVAKAMLEHHLLEGYSTTLALHSGSFLQKAGIARILKELNRRRYSEELSPFIKSYPFPELIRLFAGKMNYTSLIEHETGPYSVDRIYRYLDKKVSLHIKRKSAEIKGVYAYEDGALESFKAAKRLGLTTIYDLPIAYWETGRKLMLEEAERYPEWAETLGGGIRDSVEKLERKTQELELADVVVGPGSFVMDSLPKWASTKTTIVSPFGSPQVNKTPVFNSSPKNEPLRILFVGSMTQRKGLADLFEAFKLLGKQEAIELVVLGSLRKPLAFYKSIYPDFIYEPGRSHEEVLKLMRSCDVFCLPSIVEGRALVMQEAMSQGLPLIITTNTGGADLVEKPGAGFLVPVQSPQEIAARLIWFLDNRSLIPDMGFEAYKRSQTYTWDAYGKHIALKTQEFINHSHKIGV